MILNKLFKKNIAKENEPKKNIKVRIDPPLNKPPDRLRLSEKELFYDRKSINKANRLLVDNKIKEAIKILDEGIKKEPANEEELYYEKINILINYNMIKEANICIRSLSAFNKNNIIFFNKIYSLSMDLKKDDITSIVLNKFANADIERAVLYYWLNMGIHIRNNNIDEAIECCKNVIDLSPKFKIEMKKGKEEVKEVINVPNKESLDILLKICEGIFEFDSVKKIRVRNKYKNELILLKLRLILSDFHRKLARLYYEKNERAEAIEELNTSIKLFQNNWMAHILLSDIYLENKNYDEAFEKTQKVRNILNNINNNGLVFSSRHVKIFYSSAHSLYDLIQEYNIKLANIMYYQKRYNDVLRFLKRYQHLGHDFEYHIIKIKTYIELNLKEKAEDILNDLVQMIGTDYNKKLKNKNAKKLELKKKYSLIFLQCAYLYKLLNNKTSYISFLKASADLDDTNLFAKKGLAKYYINLNNNKSYSLYSKILKFNPNDNEALIDTALILMEKKEYQKAIDYFKSINNFKSDYAVLNDIGICYSKLGNKKDALKYFLMSYKTNKNNKLVSENLARFYIKNKQHEKAIKYLKALNPELAIEIEAGKEAQTFIKETKKKEEELKPIKAEAPQINIDQKLRDIESALNKITNNISEFYNFLGDKLDNEQIKNLTNIFKKDSVDKTEKIDITKIDEMLNLIKNDIEIILTQEPKESIFKEQDILIGSYIKDKISPEIIKWAEIDEPLLIVGKTGTGKELVAKKIHKNSNRKNKPFITVNCAGLTETLLESELFGHTRGAFTGAVQEKSGLFEEAHTGTLFLDEIGKTDISLQSKLYRAIEYGEIKKVGSSKNRYIDVRIIGALNEDLKKILKQKKFRTDLFYRFTYRINLLPLKERKDDIIPLFEFLLKKHIYKNIRKCNNNIKFNISENAVNTLSIHNWPGNIRELENLVKNVVISNKDKWANKLIKKLGLTPPQERRFKILEKYLNTEGKIFWRQKYKDILKKYAIIKVDKKISDKTLREDAIAFKKNYLTDYLQEAKVAEIKEREKLPSKSKIYRIINSLT